MSEIENAIEQFEELKDDNYSHRSLPSSWSIELALSALREKQERDNEHIGETTEMIPKPVAPVAHGRWVEAKLNGMSLYPVGQKMCSVCGQIMPSRWETMPPFCYGCGCKMDKEDET